MTHHDRNHDSRDRERAEREAADAAELDRYVGTMADVEAAILADAAAGWR